MLGAGLDLSPQSVRGVRGGVLRTNLLARSEEFDHAAWVKLRSTVTANAIAAPGGATTADKIAEATDTATTRNVGQNISVTSGTTYTISVHARAAERGHINVRFASGFASGNVTFDLSGGTRSNGGAVVASAITDAGGGWWRCSASFTATSSTTAGAQIFLSNGSTITYDGVAGNGVHLWGAMVETGATATAYIPTAASPASAP
jgi:hypothetical protein